MEYSIDYFKLAKKDSKSPFQNHYVKPILFSEESNLNSSITNVIEEYSNKLFEYKNDLKPREDDKLLVKYGPNTTELRVDTKSELLNGLTFTLLPPYKSDTVPNIWGSSCEAVTNWYGAEEWVTLT